MSINPINSYTTSLDALYYTKGEINSAIASLSSLSFTFTNPVVSSITVNPSGTISNPAVVNAQIATVSSISVSSINGFQSPLPLQLQTTNSGVQSGFAVPSAAWTAFVSTPATFAWTAGKTYDAQTALGLNLTATPAASANIIVGLGTQSGMATPQTQYAINTKTGDTQILGSGMLRGLVTPSASGTGSLVAYLYGSQAGYTVSGQMTNSAISPATLNQLN